MENRCSEVRLKPDTTYGAKPGITYVASAFRRTLIVLLVTAPLYAQQNDRARTEALAKRAGDRLQALQREADRLASDERNVLNELKKLEIDRQLKAEELKQLTADQTKVAADLDALGARSASLEKSEQAARPELRARVVEIYKLGKARYVRVLLSAPDLKRFTEATRTVATLAKLDRERVASHEKTLAELKSARKTLEERQRQVVTLRANAEKAEAALQRAAVARNKLVRDIDEKRDLTAQLSGELQSAQQKLQAALAGSGFGVAGTASPDVSLPLRPFRGDLDWPVAGTVRSRFGRGSRGNGIEIDSDEGADARAIHDGTVAFAGTFSGFGNLVILDHGSQTFSLYGDLLDIAVKKGAKIDKGQPVGTTGATATGTSGMYFELRVDGKPVDPLQWLKRR